jgi:hypothetical protein
MELVGNPQPVLTPNTTQCPELASKPVHSSERNPGATSVKTVCLALPSYDWIYSCYSAHDAKASTGFQLDHVRPFGSLVGKKFARDQWGLVHGLVLQLYIQRVALISPSTILVQRSKSSWPKQQLHARHRCSIKRPQKINSEDTGRPKDH